jgi:hypothetical protein
VDHVIRAKGLVWVATRHDLAAQLALAGKIVSVNPMGLWAAALPEEEWAEMDEETKADIQSTFDGPYGDRRQETVWIGRGLDREALRAHLEAALLTDVEFAVGPEAWQTFEDPLPAWVAEGSDEDGEACPLDFANESVLAELSPSRAR